MTTYKVPYGLNVSVRISREGDQAYVDVLAPLYVRKEWRMSHCYKADSFSDYKILNDGNFISVMLNAYGSNH